MGYKLPDRPWDPDVLYEITLDNGEVVWAKYDAEKNAWTLSRDKTGEGVSTLDVTTVPIPTLNGRVVNPRIGLSDLTVQFDVNWFLAHKVSEHGDQINSIQLELENVDSPNDGAINVNAGSGLEATGLNATADQSINTTRVLSAKTADGITIDGNGAIIIDPNFNLDGNITPPGNGRITINDSSGNKVGEFTVNQDGPTVITLPEVLIPDSLHPKGFIDVNQPAPDNPSNGDIYIQHRDDLADVVADASFVGIAGRTIEDGTFVMFGVDNIWHAGGNATPALPEPFPEAPDDGNVYVRNGQTTSWDRGLPYDARTLPEIP
jgi:hypothetical protein